MPKNTITDWCEYVNAWAKVKGWNDNESLFPEFIALVHTELSEALEEFRNGRECDEIHYPSPPGDKPEGIPIELADVLIRIFHFAGRYNIDLLNALEIKMQYNAKRPVRHGGKKI